MTKTASFGIVALVLAAGTLLRSQVSTADHRWEYAAVMSGQTWGEQQTPGGPYAHYATAHSCIGGTDGCSSSVTYKVPAEDIGAAMLKGASTLGEQGWEMTGAVSGPNGERTIYFKRPKPAGQ